MFWGAPPKVEFLCDPQDEGVIPEPYRAGGHLPAWFKALPPRLGKKEKLQNATVKRCMPVLDAMNEGWIIPLCADVEIVTNADASGVTYKWNFYKSVIENHGLDQIAGHPELPKPPMKFMNYWLIKVPPGYDLLFVPPLNRPDSRFTCFSGLVRGEYFEYINFPFFFNEPNFTGIIEAGTPLVQVIPLSRARQNRGLVRAMTKTDTERLALTRRRRQSHESYYRDTVRRDV